MLTIEEFLSDLSDRDIKLWLDRSDRQGDLKLKCNAPKGALTPEIRTLLADHKSEIIAFLQFANLRVDAVSDDITAAPKNIDLPLSFAQTRLWFMNQLEGGVDNHSIPMPLRLDGVLNFTALERTIAEIVRRHESLRTTFQVVNGQTVQVISEAIEMPIPVVDLQDLTTDEQSIEVRRLASMEFLESFNLAVAPLLRVKLLQLGEKVNVLLITMHHIISDGWSMGIFMRELSVLYEAFCLGNSSPLLPLTLQYADFAYWQRNWLTGDVLDAQLNYWKHQLAGLPPLLELPTDRPRAAVQTYTGEVLDILLDREITQNLKALSQRSGTTLFMTLIAGLATLLYRYSGQTDIAIGSLIANRNRSEIESLIGFFVNVLVLRTKFDDNPTFIDLLDRVKQMTFGAYEHQDLPFEKLVEELHPERSLSHAPLYQVMFMLENASNEELHLPGLTITPIELEDVSARDDLLLSMAETDEGELVGGMVYKTDLFDRTTINRMMAHFRSLMAAIGTNSNQRVGNLSMLSPAEFQQLTIDWNNTATDAPLDLCFPQLFERTVARTPNSVAVVYGDLQFTYQELNNRANRWAKVLIDLGIETETIVALIGDRNLDFLTAILAIFKAGGAYLPLNPDTPIERLEQILAQSKVGYILTSERLVNSIDSIGDRIDSKPQLIKFEDLDTRNPALGLSQAELEKNLPIRCTPDNLAYIIYTSGSTGIPKGVMLEHRGMLNHLYVKIQDLQLTQTDIIAQTAAATFDISIWQFLAALLVGGKVEIIPQATVTDPARLLATIADRQISIVEIVPSLLRMILTLKSLIGKEGENNSSPLPFTLYPSCTERSRSIPLPLRWLILTGETLPPQLAHQWLTHYPNIPLLNAYGPTECSDDVTHYPIHTPPNPELLNLPIGKPVANTQIYILDSQHQPVPIGITGELYVGGAGVGRGYLHAPEQTAKAFIPNPFSSGRLYKTGDKARYLPDGNIEFLGRLDYQVKIRGFRIELGEIEAGLRQLPTVSEAVVIDRAEQSGSRYLVAYVVPSYSADGLTHSQSGSVSQRLKSPLVMQSLDGAQTKTTTDIDLTELDCTHPYPSSEGIVPHTPISSGELRQSLKDKLPDYMVPSVFVILEQMPLTANGKIDRQALPAPDVQVGLTNNYIPPKTPTQQVIAGVWAEVLNLPQISIEDNFFELGGHSLLGTQIISRLRSVFAIELPLRALFEAPTIVQLGEAIAAIRQTGAGIPVTNIEPVARTAELPLSFGQSRLWFLDRLEGDNANYNIPTSLHLVGELNIHALEQTIQALIDRHESLRTNFPSVNGVPIQAISSNVIANINTIDLQKLSAVDRDREVEGITTAEAETHFNLATDSLLRVTLLQLGAKSHLLLITMHHIISDGWSMGVFIDEFSTLYTAYCHAEAPPLNPLPIQYADFAHWQRQWLSGAVLQAQIDYWKQQLTGAPPLIDLPTDRPRPALGSYQGGFIQFPLSPSESPTENRQLAAKLNAIGQKSGTTLFMTLLAAFATLLSRYSGQDDIVIGSPIANRNRRETESLIGFFVNTLVLRTQLHGNPTFIELLDRVRTATLGAYDHQDLPFEKLVEELQPERSLSYTPLYQVMFLLQNRADTADIELPGVKITNWEPESEELRQQATFSHKHQLEKSTTTDDLLLSIEETESGLIGGLLYNSDLFDGTTIERMVGHFQTLIANIAEDPDRSISTIPLLTPDEQQQLRSKPNQTAADYPLDRCFHQLFEQQVTRTPNAVAAVFAGEKLTYQQLNDRANSWANYLVNCGVKAETLVALLGDRNLDFLTAILAIFKAGGAYLPLNPNNPVDRLAQVLEQSQAPFILTTNQLSPLVELALASLDNLPTQLLDWAEMSASELSTDNLPIRSNPDNLAYVIFTSGSTGKPKGAMLEQKGMINHLYAKVTDLQLTATDVVAQTAPQSFDISVWQLLSPLLVGGKVEIIPNEMVAPTQLLELLATQGISILEIVPSLLRMMIQHIELTSETQPNLSALRWMLLTGETLPPQLCTQWLTKYPNIPMMNAYGPTECSDDVTHYAIHQPPTPEILNLPIGTPIANTQLYILDIHMQPVPFGVAGELYVGGVGVGRGYINNHTQTQTAFINNPFGTGRLYKTGDKARYLPDNNIEFLGRLDYQVKIRGFRIELGEIEAVLAQSPRIETAAVTVHEEKGNRYLVGYVVPTTPEYPTPITPSELRQFLKDKLPDYMVPAAFIVLASMPLTPNGKIDRQALPAPDFQLSLNASFVAPSDPLELQLTHIWKDVLHLQAIGIHDNFFDLGGHSLLAIHLISQIQQQFGQNISLASFFQGATIEDMANILRQKTDTATWSTLVPIQTGSGNLPFFCVHPGVGTVLAYIELARQLGSDQPFYGLESLGLAAENKSHERVEDMAAHYIAAIQTIQPQGPYNLGGWSFGGLVAFEMAQQLQATGQQVSLLALMDTSALVDSEEFAAEDRQEYADFLTELVVGDDGQNLGLPPKLEPAQTEDIVRIFQGHIEAANNYRAQPYQGKVTLFLAEDGLVTESDDPKLGWDNLATAGVEIHSIPGAHHTMVSQPSVQILAKKLRHCLEIVSNTDRHKSRGN